MFKLNLKTKKQPHLIHKEKVRIQVVSITWMLQHKILLLMKQVLENYQKISSRMTSLQLFHTLIMNKMKSVKEKRWIEPCLMKNYMHIEVEMLLNKMNLSRWLILQSSLIRLSKDRSSKIDLYALEALKVVILLPTAGHQVSEA